MNTTRKRIAWTISLSFMIVLLVVFGYFWLTKSYSITIYNEDKLLENQTIINQSINDYPFLNWYKQEEQYDLAITVLENTGLAAKWDPSSQQVTAKETILNLASGDKVQLAVIFYPPQKINQEVVWHSEDPSIATVTSKGEVTAYEEGTTYIRATAPNGKEAKIEVTVKRRLAIKGGNLIIDVGEEVTLKLEELPHELTASDLTWETKDATILSITEDGVIKGLKDGKTEVCIQASSGKKDSITVTVKEVLPETVAIKGPNETIIGTPITLEALFEPANTSLKDVSWEISDENIALIEQDGTIIGLKPGKVIVTVNTSNAKSNTIELTFKTKTEGKTAIFFGDSITYGSGGTPKGYSWANYISDHYDLKDVVNAGKPGWRISNTKNNWITSFVKEYQDEEYDYVILHGGTNDISAKVPLGEYQKDDFSGNYDTTTFLGGLEAYIYTAKKQWPKTHIGYIINYATPNSNKNRVELSESYYEAMKEVLDKWDIAYLDLYSGSTLQGISYSELLKVDSDTYLKDNLHLNAEGYEAVSPHIYLWMNSL